MSDTMKELGGGVGTWLSTNGWLMFLIFVLLIIGCGGCFGGGCI
ncbi:MAG: hypothetical protein PVH64_07170 [Bacillota bacterium]|jgi:hypothetical protein